MPRKKNNKDKLKDVNKELIITLLGIENFGRKAVQKARKAVEFSSDKAVDVLNVIAGNPIACKGGNIHVIDKDGIPRDKDGYMIVTRK